MRIEWDPLDTSVLTVRDGVVAVDGQVLQRNVLDARWLADGPILTIDEGGGMRWFRNGEQTNRHPRQLAHVLGASIAMGGSRVVLISDIGFTGPVVVEDVGGGNPFTPELGGVSLSQQRESLSVALSGDGGRLAISYATDEAGRGLAVFDVDRRTVLDRTYQAQPIDRSARAPLVFDYAGKRIAQALPERDVPALGVFRVNRDDRYPRTRRGGMSAVALEYRGNLVAYAYREPPPGARGRLQFDYLDTAVAGDTAVEVLDTQTLESELPDLVALAFSRDRRRLACLASTGAIEIVPVP